MLIISKSSTDAYLQTVVSTYPAGTIVKVKDYENVISRLEIAAQNNPVFRYQDIRSGNSLFAQYGHSHIIVTENSHI